MISSSEIKAGNWISLQYPGSLLEAYRVLERDDDGITINGKGMYALSRKQNGWCFEEENTTTFLQYNGIKGIPLSGEMLEGYGFTCNENRIPRGSHQIPAGKDYYFLEGFTVLRHTGEKGVKYTDETGEVIIHFLHQLQNLYADLTGKELNVNIPRYNFKRAPFT